MHSLSLFFTLNSDYLENILLLDCCSGLLLSLSLHAAAVTHTGGFNLSLSKTLICEGNKFIDKYVTSTRVEYYNTIICSEERNVITGLRSLGF